MNKLNKLMSMCKASVTVSINDHKGCYITAEQCLYERAEMQSCKSLYNDMIAYHDITEDVANNIIDSNNLVCVQFYPRTPVSFYCVIHHDLEAAIDEAISILEKQ